MARANDHIVRLATAAQLACLLLLLMAVGCAAPWLDSYEYERSALSHVEPITSHPLTVAKVALGPIEIEAVGSPTFAPNLSSALASAREEEANTAYPPALHFQVSTPPGYLRGHRDDFVEVPQGAIYSEVGFAITGDSVDDLHVEERGSTEIGSKPINESYGLQFAVTHEIPSFGFVTEILDNTKLNFSYGARYLQLDEYFFIDFSYSYSNFIAGYDFRTRSETHLDNALAGPQVALNLSKNQYGWDFQLGSSYMLGYNFLTSNQLFSSGFNSPLSVGATPGAVNRPLLNQPVVWRSEQKSEELTAIGEVRAVAKYPIARNLAFQLRYTGLYISEFQRAYGSFNWRLPDFFGGTSSVSQDLWVDRLYAGIEWRR